MTQELKKSIVMERNLRLEGYAYFEGRMSLPADQRALEDNDETDKEVYNYVQTRI